MTLTNEQRARIGGLALYRSRGKSRRERSRYMSELAKHGWETGAITARPAQPTYDEMMLTAAGRRAQARIARELREPAGANRLRLSGRSGR